MFKENSKVVAIVGIVAVVLTAIAVVTTVIRNNTRAELFDSEME